MNRLAPTFQNRRRSSGGFSLVEVALALGVCSFCLTSIFGLLMVGLEANDDTVQRTAAAGIIRSVAADFWTVNSSSTATTRFKINLPTAITSSAQPDTTLFFQEDGSLQPNASTATYRVDIAYGARTSLTAPAPIKIMATWPAAANPSAGKWPTHFKASLVVVTALDAQ